MNSKQTLEKTDLADASNSLLSALQKLSSHDPHKSPLCEECDKEPSKYHCSECEQNLCQTCDQQIHNKGARKNHQRTPLENNEHKSSDKDSLSSSSESKAPLLVPTHPSITDQPIKNGSRISSVSTDSSNMPLPSNYSPFVPRSRKQVPIGIFHDFV